MTLLDDAVPAPSDAELLARVRGGDVQAYGELFDRHRDAAYRLARQLARGPDADDLVSEAFAKVLSLLQAGRGPDVAFRAYLLTAVRRLHVDRLRSGQRVQPTDDVSHFDNGVPFQDTAVDEFERSAAARAFGSLPERWQVVLWHLEVEEQKPAEVGVLLGLSPNGVSALAYRAREGLRQAYLRMHLADTAGDACRWTTEHLGAYVRSGLSRRDAHKVEEHLGECARCAGLYAELTEVNGNLRGLLAPLLLGTAAAAYLNAGTVAGATGLLVPGLSKIGAILSTPTQAVAAGGVAAAAATVAVVGYTGLVGAGNSHDNRPPLSAALAVPGTHPGRTLTGSATTPGVPGPSTLGFGALGGVPSIATAAGPASRLSPDGTVALAAAPLQRLAATPTDTATAPASPGTTVSSTPSAPTTATTLPPGTTTSPPSTTPTTPYPSPSTTPTTTPTDPSPTDPSPTGNPTTPNPPPPSPSPSPSTTTPGPTTSDLSVAVNVVDANPAATVVSIAVGQTQPADGQLTLTVTLPPNSTATPAASVWSCSLAGSTLSCTAGGDSGSSVLDVTVVPGAAGPLTATVDGPSNSDPNPANNSVSVQLTGPSGAPSSASPGSGQ